VHSNHLATLITQRLVRDEILSALPDAPVRDDRIPPHSTVHRNRARLAALLRAIAAGVDPQVAPGGSGRPATMR